MAQKKFSELEVGAVDGTSIFAQTKTEDGSLVSKSASSPSLAGYIGTSHQFAGLSTTAKNLVGAINEAASMGGVVQLTQAEYTALTTAEKMNGSIYKLTDKAIFYCLDEEYHAVKELLTSEYEALSTAEQNNGTIYIQTDAETTGSDIAVSDSASTSIAEAIEAITPSNTVLSAAWIANSSSAFDTALTDSITVTAGVWMILWGHPTQSANAGAYINGLATNSDIDDAFKSYDDGVAYSKNSMIVKFTGNATLQLRSGGSASVTFSNIERGYLKAYKLA